MLLLLLRERGHRGGGPHAEAGHLPAHPARSLGTFARASCPQKPLARSPVCKHPVLWHHPGARAWPQCSGIPPLATGPPGCSPREPSSEGGRDAGAPSPARGPRGGTVARASKEVRWRAGGGGGQTPLRKASVGPQKLPAPPIAQEASRQATPPRLPQRVRRVGRQRPGEPPRRPACARRPQHRCRDPTPAPPCRRPPQPVRKRPGLPGNAACISPDPAGTAHGRVRAVPAGGRHARLGPPGIRASPPRRDPPNPPPAAPWFGAQRAGDPPAAPVPSIPTPLSPQQRRRCQRLKPRPWRGDSPQLPTTKCSTVAGEGGGVSSSLSSLFFFSFFSFFPKALQNKVHTLPLQNPPPSVRASERRAAAGAAAPPLARSGRLRADGARGRTSPSLAAGGSRGGSACV